MKQRDKRLSRCKIQYCCRGTSFSPRCTVGRGPRGASLTPCVTLMLAIGTDVEALAGREYRNILAGKELISREIGKSSGILATESWPRNPPSIHTIHNGRSLCSSVRRGGMLHTFGAEVSNTGAGRGEDGLSSFVQSKGEIHCDAFAGDDSNLVNIRYHHRICGHGDCAPSGYVHRPLIARQSDCSPEGRVAR